MIRVLLLDDNLIGECNDLPGAELEQVFRRDERVGGFHFMEVKSFPLNYFVM